MKTLLLISLLITGCAGFNTPRLDIPFVVFEVNDLVNQTPYLADDENYGVPDYWATPAEFYAKGRADCEDYAIAKYFLLKKAGIPTDKLLLAHIIVDDGDTDHMVLIYDNKFVLDNGKSRIKPIEDYIDFELKYTFNENMVNFNGVKTDNVGFLPKWKDVLARM